MTTMKTEKKTRHWLHVLLIILTALLWLPVYVLVLVANEQHNKFVRAYNEGVKDASRVGWGNNSSNDIAGAQFREAEIARLKGIADRQAEAMTDHVNRLRRLHTALLHISDQENRLQLHPGPEGDALQSEFDDLTLYLGPSV